VLLALKVIVKECFIDASSPGDFVDSRPGEAELGKLLECGVDNSGFCSYGVSFAPFIPSTQEKAF
jgi:hypothetical protein